jgi:uncharacterized protein (DUF433 family)
MTQTATAYKYIELNEQNVPIVAGTTMKVIELIRAHIAYGWSPAELHLNHRYLTMSQIHSAFAYYWDHKEELDADMQRRFEYAEKLRKEAGESALAKKLRDRGLIK